MRFLRTGVRTLGDLLDSYNRICSYLCLYIPRRHGSAQLSTTWSRSPCSWDQVYEWRNYRLACSLMNARKGADSQKCAGSVRVEDGWFALELVGVSGHARQSGHPRTSMTESREYHRAPAAERSGVL